jgi:hypothetical protein
MVAEGFATPKTDCIFCAVKVLYSLSLERYARTFCFADFITKYSSIKMVSLDKHLRGDRSLKLKTSISYNALVVNRYTGKE